MSSAEFHDSTSSMQMSFLGTIQQEMQDSSHVSLVDETSDRIYSDRLRDVHEEEAEVELPRRDSKNRKRDKKSSRRRSPTRVRSSPSHSNSRRGTNSPTPSDGLSGSGGSRRSNNHNKSSRSQYNPQDDEDSELIDFEPTEDDDLDNSRGKRISYTTRTTRAAGGRNLWDQDHGIVDQGVNLMDVETGHYGDRGMAGLRSKSLVDIFLTDESHRGGNYGVEDLGYSHKRNRNRKCLLVLVLIGLSIIFITMVPNFGLVAGGKKNDKKENKKPPTASPTAAPIASPTKGPEELIEEEVEISAPKEEEKKEDETNAEEVSEERLDNLKFYLVYLDITDEEQLNVMGSPSNKAMHWIAEEDPAKMPVPGFQGVETNNLEAEPVILQRYALVVFYYSIQASSSNGEGDSSRLLQQSEEANRQGLDKTWLSAHSVCKWRGVVCDSDEKSVTKLNLPGHLLQGTIPREILVGEAMPYLKELDLSKNQLHGSLPEVAPEGDTVGSQLEVLKLGENQLTGSLDNLVGLKSLEEVFLGDNGLTGTLDGLAALTGLKSLQLPANKLSGTIPEDLHSLTSLRELMLSGNELSGDIPDSLGNLANLRLLYLDGNDIEGEVPSQLGHLQVLQELRLEGNEITGIMPDEICALRDKKLSTLESDCSKKISCDCCTECW